MKRAPEISVIVCTRNRGNKLEATLNSLAEQDFSDPWELILVDNGSSDETAEVIERFKAASPLNVGSVFEPIPGLSRARNRGLGLARGRIVAFTDDDCYPKPGFLSAIKQTFADGDYAFCGGRVLLFDPSDRKITIQELATRVELEPHAFVRSGLIHGANMALRRDSVLAIGGFDERLGAGSDFKSGEDTDLLRRLSAEGLRGVYDPRIEVFHHHGRKTIEAEEGLRRAYARGRGACMVKHCLHRPSRSIYLRHWYWYLRRCGFALAAREMWAGLAFWLRYGPGPERVWQHPSEGLRSGNQP